MRTITLQLTALEILQIQQALESYAAETEKILNAYVVAVPHADVTNLSAISRSSLVLIGKLNNALWPKS